MSKSNPTTAYLKSLGYTEKEASVPGWAAVLGIPVRPFPCLSLPAMVVVIAAPFWLCWVVVSWPIRALLGSQHLVAGSIVSGLLAALLFGLFCAFQVRSGWVSRGLPSRVKPPSDE